MSENQPALFRKFLSLLGILGFFLLVPASPVFPLDTPADNSCFVYPSPAASGGTAWAVYNMPQTGSVLVLVYNEAGDLATQVSDFKGPGLQQTAINLLYFRNGVYICQVILGGTQALQPFKFLVAP